MASNVRIEKDTFGPIEVAADRLWGAQTQRSLENFRISGERMPPGVRGDRVSTGDPVIIVSRPSLALAPALWSASAKWIEQCLRLLRQAGTNELVGICQPVPKLVLGNGL